MVVYNGSLYISTYQSNGAEIYRYDGGTDWTKVTQAAGTIAASGTTLIDYVWSMTIDTAACTPAQTIPVKPKSTATTAVLPGPKSAWRPVPSLPQQALTVFSL